MSDPSVPCEVQEYTSPAAPREFDLISGGADFMQELTGGGKQPTKQVGTETIAGVAAKILEVTAPSPEQGKVRIWVAAQSNYPLKWVSISPDGKQQRTVIEVKQFSFAKPPASTFTPPTNCGPLNGTSSSNAGVSSASVTVGAPAPARAQVAPGPGAASGPLKLQADIATAAEVVLSWSGAGGKQWRLERKTGREDWAAIATAFEGKTTDSKIGAFATYNYRVTSGSTTSNVITVGPPPTGFQTIAPRPDRHPDTAFGRFISPVLDSNGDPAVAFVYADPDGDGRFEDTQLMFVSWDRATYHWKDPVFCRHIGPLRSAASHAWCGGGT